MNLNAYTEMHCGECGIQFCVPTHFYNECRNVKGKSWHCPNGHSRVFRESDVDIQRRRAERAEQEQERLRQLVLAERAEAAKHLRALTKLKKRTSAGTCPCCQRTFANMANHMKKQHPEYVREGGAKVVALTVKREAS